MTTTITTPRTKRVLTEIEIIAKISDLLPGLSKKGLEYVGHAINDLYAQQELPLGSGIPAYDRNPERPQP